MNKIDVVRAWRDEEYRNSLTPEERASLPENPAGLATISDDVLRSVAGGCGYTSPYYTKPVGSCVTYPEQCP
jgi:mersacidin/lichenicidin family type 2 lantibiotic